MYCVVVHFNLKSGFEESFLKKVVENAETSRKVEPGCRSFDVCVGEKSGEVLLYELYDDEAAFQKHLSMQHFKHFDQETSGWLVEKRVMIYRRISPEPEAR